MPQLPKFCEVRLNVEGAILQHGNSNMHRQSAAVANVPVTKATGTKDEKTSGRMMMMMMMMMANAGTGTGDIEKTLTRMRTRLSSGSVTGITREIVSESETTMMMSGAGARNEKTTTITRITMAIIIDPVETMTVPLKHSILFEYVYNLVCT